MKLSTRAVLAAAVSPSPPRRYRSRSSTRMSDRGVACRSSARRSWPAARRRSGLWPAAARRSGPWPVAERRGSWLAARRRSGPWPAARRRSLKP